MRGTENDRSNEFGRPRALAKKGLKIIYVFLF